ncbi:MAG: phosphate ABC transporter substrate-binding protein PstS [Nitriliruptor sp.]|nr:MAG: phosphate ABC transporter substrate-binding protein PstS [Nitriliruptor sp.]
MRTFSRMIAALAAASLLAVACGDGGVTAPDETPDDAGDAEPAADEDADDGSDDNGSSGGARGDLVGAGATFVNPIFVDWIFEYQNEVNPAANINYQSIGSGGGIEQFLLEQVDFGASERYLRDDALAEGAESRGCDAIQFPIVFGSVTIAFNDPELDGLILDGTTIGDIFERRVTNYNDPQIQALNPGRELPDQDIIPVHRSDGSGTTSVFTTYLEQDDAVDGWTLGSGTEVQWPSGTIGGQGNEGVAAGIQQNPGGLGYLNQAYVLLEGFPQAQVINADGEPITATLEATTAGLDGLDIPDNFQFDILDIGGDGFPITGTAWVFAWECGYDDETAELMKEFWTWAVTEGAPIAQDLGYATIGPGLEPRILEAIERINSAN